MLTPDQMTDQTLDANIRLYREIHRSQPADFTPEDHARMDTLTMEKERRISGQDTLPDGLYVSRAWAHEPHKSIMWARRNARWECITGKSEHDVDDREALATPQTFYGLGWEKQIVALVAAS